jgi:hypothetical protein
MEEKRKAYRGIFLMRKPEVTISLERPRRRWDNSIKMDLEGIYSNILDWICMAPVTGPW